MKIITVNKLLLEDILSANKTQVRTLDRNIKDLRIIHNEKFFLYCGEYFIGICLTTNVFYDKVLCVEKAKYDPWDKESFIEFIQDIVAQNGAIDILNDTLLFIEFEIIQDKCGNLISLKNKRGNLYYEVQESEWQRD